MAHAQGRGNEATIDLSALRANAREALRLAHGRELIAVLKANAYGHGAPEVARALLEAGAARLAVVSVEEAAELRSAAVAAPILILGGLADTAEAELAAALQLTPVLHDAGGSALAAAAARKAKRRIRVHVEVDTGMSRMGVPDHAALELLGQIDGESLLELEGVFTHFSRADEVDLAPSFEQLRRFQDELGRAGERGITPASIHVANSAALIAGKDLIEALPGATAVRPGLMLYGVRPAPQRAAELRPVMCLRSRVVRVHELSKGERVGYGGTFAAAGDGPGGRTRIATLPLGYADGIACSNAGRGYVWIQGERRPIAGRVSMDYLGVDVGEAEVEVGDEAVIFGNAGAETSGISVEEAAEWAGTIPYELLVRVGSRVPRRFID